MTHRQRRAVREHGLPGEGSCRFSRNPWGIAFFEGEEISTYDQPWAQIVG